MYVDTDFIMALIKEDDWLTEAAEKVYTERKDELWTSRYAMLELLLISYRENWKCTEVLANAEQLIEVKCDTEEILTAARKVEEKDLTPFDALHLISANKTIVSSDKEYDKHTERLKLEELRDEQ